MKTPEPNRHFAELELDQIDTAPNNPRRTFKNLEELAKSIGEVGVLQPITVRPVDGGRHELIAGERRWRASQLAGKTTIPAVILTMNDKQAAEARLVENVGREDLTELEEADAYQELIEKHGHTVETLAAKTGKSEATIRARLKLLDLAPGPRKALADLKLTASHAILIAGLGDPKIQEEALGTYFKGRILGYEGEGKAITEPLSVRELKQWIHRTYLLALSSAPFATDDATLVPDAGACGPCPHRTGNQRELFDAKSKDLCTKASCFEKKKAAAWDRAAADAQRAGLRVLGEKETLKVFPTASATKVAADSPLVDVEEDLPYDLQERSGKKTWKALLGKDAPPAVAITRDGAGRARELVDRKACIDRATEAGKLAERNAKGAAVKESKHDFDAERKKQAEKHAARLGAVNAALEKIAAGAAKPLVEGKDHAFWKLLLGLIISGITAEDAKKVFKRRELVPEDTKGKTALEVVEAATLAATAKLKGDELRGLVVELLAADRAAFLNSPEYGKRLQLAASHFKVDLKELETKAAAEVKAKAAASAEKKSAKKPAKGGAR